MTGEVPGVEYNELNTSGVVNAVLGKIARGHFAPFLANETVKGLREHLELIDAAVGSPTSFVLQIGKPQDDETTPSEAWLALEYGFNLASGKCGLTALYDGSEPEGAERLELVDPDIVYPVDWDEINWAYGYNLIIQEGVFEDPVTGQIRCTPLSHDN